MIRVRRRRPGKDPLFVSLREHPASIAGHKDVIVAVGASPIEKFRKEAIGKEVEALAKPIKLSWTDDCHLKRCNKLRAPAAHCDFQGVDDCRCGGASYTKATCH